MAAAFPTMIVSKYSVQRLKVINDHVQQQIKHKQMCFFFNVSVE